MSFAEKEDKYLTYGAGVLIYEEHNKILKILLELKSRFEITSKVHYSKITTLSEELNLKFFDLNQRIDNLESGMVTLNGRMDNLESGMVTLNGRMDNLENKLDDVSLDIKLILKHLRAI